MQFVNPISIKKYQYLTKTFKVGKLYKITHIDYNHLIFSAIKGYDVATGKFNICFENHDGLLLYLGITAYSNINGSTFDNEFHDKRIPIFFWKNYHCTIRERFLEQPIAFKEMQ